MAKRNSYLDKYDQYADEYADLYDPAESDRQVRRKRKKTPNHTPKLTDAEILEQIADPMGLEGGFDTTYEPSKHEAGWLLESIGSFFNLDYIIDVLAQVKGGKEASVYRCAAHPSTGYDFLAVKVYRPRMFRNLRNDKMYREGRNMLNADGKELKPNEQRAMRAIDKKSSYGALLQHTSWLMHEYITMENLHNLGAAVPKPIASSENAILMTYHGDRSIAAPTLNSVNLPEDEAEPLLDSALHNIELMLANGIIHGDLSAYNILYWAGELTVIDFPQVVNAEGNENAYAIFQRDVTRVCDYFASQGIRRDPQQIVDRLWDKYIGTDPIGNLADLSRITEAPDDDDDDD